MPTSRSSSCSRAVCPAPDRGLDRHGRGDHERGLPRCGPARQAPDARVREGRGRRARASEGRRLQAATPYYDEPEGEPLVTALNEEEDEEFEYEEEDEEEDEPIAPSTPAGRFARKPADEDAEDETEDEEAAEADLTPQGNRRSGMTESEELDYKLPNPSLLRQSRDRKNFSGGNQEQVGEAARGDARALRHRVDGRRAGHRAAGYALRAEPRAGDEGLEGHPAQGRPRIRACLDRHPDPGTDTGQAGSRGRGPQPEQPDGVPRRHLPAQDQEGRPQTRGRPRFRRDGGSIAARRLARQGHLGPCRLDRSGQDASPTRRGHDGIGQVRLRQHDAQLDPPARDTERRSHGARRSQAGRARTTTRTFRISSRRS